MNSSTITLETLSAHACFGGQVGFYRHASVETNCDMRFSVFTPQVAKHRRVPVLYFLSGLTCNEETFMIKAGAQRVADELGLMLVAPDTSPRGIELPGDRESWDFGVGAGFYVDATEAPWSKHYRMYSYVTRELPAIIERHFAADVSKQGIFGHSMGGHGALTIGLKHPEIYKSISAFAPIAAPMQVPWGEKAFSRYLGSDRNAWRDFDASELIRRTKHRSRLLLIDQGLADQFIDSQLKPDVIEKACAAYGYPCNLRRHAGYDHGYYFIQSFIADHLRHHATHLGA